MNQFAANRDYSRHLREGAKLPAYRHYRLDGAGNISEAEWIDANDDEDAVRKVAARGLPVASEIWERNRRVARVEGKNPS